MGDRWTGYGLHMFCFLFFILFFEIQGSCCLLNSEGLALLQFQSMVDFDSYGALENWNPNDCDPCMWSGIECSDGKVVMLNLSGCDLEGALSPELGKLTNLIFLDLSKNRLSGAIPPEFGQLTTLEVLDLRDNNLTGLVPPELGELHSLKRLLLCNNRFEGTIPPEIGKLSLLSDVQFDDVFSTAGAAGICCINRKFGQSFKIGSESSNSHNDNCCSNVTDSSDPDVIDETQEHVNNVRRVLVEQAANLVSLPPDINIMAPSPLETDVLPSRSSGSFPAVPNIKPPPTVPAAATPSTLDQENETHNTADPSAASQAADNKSSADGSSGKSLIIGMLIAVLMLIFLVVLFFIIRRRAAKNIGPWKTGLSGQLQKAFVTGVPKLNRDELETACEDFSNIIFSTEGICTLYKGTLSSGVEIGVVSTAVKSQKEWSKQAELLFRKKIETLSQVNHKNFVNLIGYCEEDEPFTRMMVFEYTPNGSLFDYLHVRELEDLDWAARIRIIMGIAYCLQHLHELNPPMPHCGLCSKEIFLTDDFSAKLCDVHFWKDFISSSKNAAEHELENSESSQCALETNIHNIGILMLEIISGKLPTSEEEGDILEWAKPYLNDKAMVTKLIDPALKSFNDNELYSVCEAIQCCIGQNSERRRTMQEVVEILRHAINLSPEAATPRLSPLWWAELEILSSEGG